MSRSSFAEGNGVYSLMTGLITPGWGAKSEQFKKRKLEIFQQCLDLAIKDLKDLSNT